MSLIEELAVRLRAASDELPLAAVTAALERFGAAAEQLRRVRESSADPMGVPELGAAVECAEAASHALRVTQEHLAAYLAAIGMADGAGGAPATDRRDGHEPALPGHADGEGRSGDAQRRPGGREPARPGTPRPPAPADAARPGPQRSRPAGPGSAPAGADGSPRTPAPGARPGR